MNSQSDFNKRPSRRFGSLGLLLVSALFVFALSSCVSVPTRNPLPADLADLATIPGGEYARIWGDARPDFTDDWFTLSDEELRALFPESIGRPHHYLAISGGGQEGAFGAGLLCGWTDAGTRPEFTYVSGISTGALMAPFVFLGSEYDAQIEQLYTATSTEDLIDKRGMLSVFISDAMAGSEPLQALLERLITPEVVEAIAVEHRRGRSLVIGTTNLDAGRPVLWDIGEIAKSGDPQAVPLIRQVLLASASIPGVFPPVLIEVEVEGRIYDEMHVDGGASAQLVLYPAGVDWKRVMERLQVPGPPALYLIRNSRIDPVHAVVDNEAFAIIERSVSSMIRSQGIGNLYEIYLMAQRDGLDYHLANIPGDFPDSSEEQFDPAYMRKLFDLGYDLARKGYHWQTGPPRYELIVE